MATTMNPMPAAPGPGGGVNPAQLKGLNPQQIQQMQQVVKQCMQVLLSNESAKTIISKCRMMGHPAQVIADTVAPLLSRVHEAAMGAGKNIEMLTMMVAGVQVIATLAEMLWHADVIKSEQDMLQVVGEASKLAVDKHNNDVTQQGGASSTPPQQAAPAPGGMIAQGA